MISQNNQFYLNKHKKTVIQIKARSHANLHHNYPQEQMRINKWNPLCTLDKSRNDLQQTCVWTSQVWLYSCYHLFFLSVSPISFSLSFFVCFTANSCMLFPYFFLINNTIPIFRPLVASPSVTCVRQEEKSHYWILALRSAHEILWFFPVFPVFVFHVNYLSKKRKIRQQLKTTVDPIHRKSHSQKFHFERICSEVPHKKSNFICTFLDRKSRIKRK